MTPAAAEPVKPRKLRILGHQEIPVDHLHPHPLNPRPTFHLIEDNPELIAMGDSIRIEGLHNPIKVYELEESPGNFRILQGHRRWMAARLANVDLLDAIVVARPRTEADELEALGSEDAFKRAWSESGLFQMRYANDLARRLGLDNCVATEIATKTGLSMRQLTTAEKVFKLEAPIIALVAEHEYLRYQASLNQDHKRGPRLAASSGVRTTEFTPEKAARVWELFDVLRTQLPHAVKEWDDTELQQILAIKASKASLENMDNLLNAIRVHGKRPSPGLLTQVHSLLADDHITITSVTQRTKNAQAVRFAKAVRKAEQLDKDLVSLNDKMDQFGSDPDLMARADRVLLSLLRHADDFQRRLERHMAKLEREYNL